MTKKNEQEYYRNILNIKFTLTIAIGIGIILSLAGAIFGAFSGNYEIMYTGAGLLTARTGFNAFGKNHDK